MNCDGKTPYNIWRPNIPRRWGNWERCPVREIEKEPIIGVIWGYLLGLCGHDIDGGIKKMSIEEIDAQPAAVYNAIEFMFIGVRKTRDAEIQESLKKHG